MVLLGMPSFHPLYHGDLPFPHIEIIKRVARYLAARAPVVWSMDDFYTLAKSFNDSRTWPEVRDFLTEAAKDLRNEGR